LSKAFAEFAAGAYRDSQFMRERPDVALITARAGNGVGGGDWRPTVSFQMPCARFGKSSRSSAPLAA
jgi:hypothetical protein